MLIEPITPKLVNLGQVFQKTLLIKQGLNLELKKDTEFGKCLHGKTQNTNGSFNGTIWERILKILLLH